MNEYREPFITVGVLDFLKPEDTALCLQSVKRFVRFEHKVIYLHNGPADYPYDFFKQGLVDQYIQTNRNNGLGIGTRDLFAASFSPYTIYLQNDQYFFRDFKEEELYEMIQVMERHESCVGSISLAGSPCGQHIYSERSHLIKTDFYKSMEPILGFGGAGPYHNHPWREGTIQQLYKDRGLIHYAWQNPLVMDNGREAIRQNPDGSVWRHFPDTKAAFLVKGPIKERFVYPRFSDREWEEVLRTQTWEPGRVPENEVKDSFHVWN